MKPLLCLLVILPFISSSQNLLMNGDFEDENICTEFIKNCAPEGWISTSLWSDYYFNDPPHAYHGEHFVGIMYAGGSKANNLKNFKFLRSRLLCALREGGQYRLEFYVRSSHSRLDSVGVYFSEDDILYRQKPLAATEVPQLWVGDGVTSGLTQNWQKASLVYTATGKENFIAIGDFRKTAHRFVGKADLGDNFYFFIDQVSLVAVNPNEGLCSDMELIREEEYNFNPRHNVLEKLVYNYRKHPPELTPLSRTVVHRIDTLVIPDVLFATNSFTLNRSANATLDSFINRTGSLSIDSIVVEGHTDSTGHMAANQKLSLNRATAVAEYLKPNYKTRVVARGWASEKPVADNKTPAGRQKNRRVEIYFYVRD